MNALEQCSTSNYSPHFTLGHHPQFRNELYASSGKRDDVWQSWYALAEEYYAAHGNLLIPRNYTIRGNQLGRWIERQRAAYNGKLACGITTDRVANLNRVGMVWKLETRAPWDEWYRLAESYYAENGHLSIQKNGIYKGKALGSWIGEQRKRYKTGKLSKKQIICLEKIGMLWQVGKERCPWDQTFQEASDYFSEHGNLKIPIAYRTDKGTRLWQWVQMQREVYNGTRPGYLSEKQIQLLSSIGMVWSVYDAAWESMYALAVRYYEQYGDLMVKQNYVTETGERLGQWISVQRQDYKKKGISGEMSDRIARLNQIGMVWFAGKKPRHVVSAA